MLECMVHRSRLCPLIAGAGLLAAVGIGAAGQIAADPRLDPLNLTISEYAVAARGGVTGAMMGALGVAALALVRGLRAVGAPVRGAPERLMLVWSGAMLAAAAVSFGTGAFAMAVHRAASVVAFVALPIAAALLVPRLAEDDGWRTVARSVEWLALACGFGLLALTYVTLPGEGVMVGLAEWTLLVIETALLAVLTLQLLQITLSPALTGMIQKFIDKETGIPLFPVLFSRRS